MSRRAWMAIVTLLGVLLVAAGAGAAWLVGAMAIDAATAAIIATVVVVLRIVVILRCKHL